MNDSVIRKLKLLRLVLCFLLLLSIGVLLAFELTDFSADTFTRRAYDVLYAVSGEISDENSTMLGTETLLTEGYKDGVISLSRSVLTVYNSSLVPYSSHAVTLKNPVLSCCGDTIVAFDRGGTSVYVFDSFNQIASFSSTEVLYNVAVSEKGKICLVTSQTDYRGAVTIHNRNGSGKTVTWNCADCYLFDADFYGDTLYVIGLKPNNETTDTVVYQLDAETGTELYHAVIEGQMPLTVHAMKDGSLCVIATYGVWSVYEGTAREVYRFSGTVPTKTALSDGYVLFSLPDESDGTERVLLLDHHGSLCFSVSSEAVSDLALSESDAFVLTEGEAVRYDMSGNAEERYETDGLVLSMHTDGTHLFFVSSRLIQQVQ